MKILNASFRKASSNPASLLDARTRCIALAGRSNVGKSTLINRLVNSKKLARTSNTPGCTRYFNLYEINYENEKGLRKRIYLLDMPGFGYAKVSQKDRHLLKRKIADFLEEAEGLDALCILNDIRRMPEEEELGLRDLAFEAGIAVFVILTKTDKIRKNEVKKQSTLIAKAYGLEATDLILSGASHDLSDFWNVVIAH